MIIADIKKFAVHDGDGIRTTVFFKGCPLKCRWCHNPECIGFKPELGYYADKCAGCGACVKTCPAGAHTMAEGKHVYDRSKCVACGKCVKTCPRDALILYGREMTADELLPVLLEDRDFYENSGGGVTLSGGECLSQPDGCAELLRKLKENGIHTAVDTCGFAGREAIDGVLPYTDIFLYDIKHISEEGHIYCTGRSNNVILENIGYIAKMGAKIEVRIPFVPGYNDSAIPKIGEFLSGLNAVGKVKLLPYHNLAGSKYAAMGMPNTLPDVTADAGMLENAAGILRSFGLNVTCG